MQYEIAIFSLPEVLYRVDQNVSIVFRRQSCIKTCIIKTIFHLSMQLLVNRPVSNNINERDNPHFVVFN